MVPNIHSPTTYCGIFSFQLFAKHGFSEVLPNIRSRTYVRFRLRQRSSMDYHRVGAASVQELRRGAAIGAAFGRPAAALKTRPGAASMSSRELQLGAAPATVKFSQGSCKIHGSCISAAASSCKTCKSCDRSCGRCQKVAFSHSKMQPLPKFDLKNQIFIIFS